LKVLILTYYWPPAGGSGVQRWLYFTKYLRDFGIEPIIFTVDNPHYPIEDKDLEVQIPDNLEVLRQRIWEPNNIFGKKDKKISAGFLQKKPSMPQKLLQYIRANYFIPDARKYWIRPSIRKLTKYLNENPVDWIISTGPPHSVHLIGQKLQQKTNIKWLADFRDPWTDIDYFHQLPLTKKSLDKHQRLEHAVLSNADIVTVVGKSMQEKYTLVSQECHVITNGFDDDGNNEPSKLDLLFTLTHIGILNSDRDPIVFWRVLRSILDENDNFEKELKVNLIGKIADEVKESIRKYDLEKYISYTNYIPHNSVLKYQKKSQVLLLFINQVPNAKGIITGKVFEYLQAKRPILALAPTDGDLAEILDTTNSGVVVAFDDEIALKQIILDYFKDFKENKLTVDSQNTGIYHRKNLTEQLAELLKKD
jgi:hypothetical protein